MTKGYRYTSIMIFRHPLSSVLQCIFCLSLTLSGGAATSVTQFGVTWEFDKDYTTGQFVNGDYYVVENSPGEGVILKRMTPDWDGTRNGAEINPDFWGSQGFDSRMKNNQFSSDLNIADDLPIKLETGTSVLKSIGKSDQAVGDKPQLETIAILTVLDKVPAPGSFRPFYQNADKTVRYNASDLDFSILRSLKRSKVSNVPNLDSVAAKFERPWIEIHGSWVGRYTHPEKNMPTYGREMAYALGDGLLSLQLDYSNEKKRETYIRLVQIGLDIYGAILNGGSWDADGGHNQGRKMPLILAALALGDEEMLQFGNKEHFYKFQEDQQTFYVSQTEVDMTASSRWTPDKRGGTPIPYTASDIGTPEWGFKHKKEPNRDNKLWTTYYRDVSGSATLPHVLTAHLMGVEDIWNHPPLFDYYTERYWTKEEKKRSNTVNEIKLFYASMWDNFRYSNADNDISAIQAPTITPYTGTYTQPLDIVITPENNSTEIRYTTDGSDPHTSSLLYTGPINISETTTISAIAIDTSTNSISSITKNELSIEFSGAQIEPAGGKFISPIWVKLASETNSSEIRYTLDGSEPTQQSDAYTSPIYLDQSTSVRAQAFSNGSPLATEALEVFSIGEYASSEDWNNIDVPALSGIFNVSFNATPSGDYIDSVTGLSATHSEVYSNLACIVRFSPNGKIDVRDGSSYRSDLSFEYKKGNSYHILLSVDSISKKYTVRVDGNVIAQNYSFRTEQADAEILTYISMKSAGSDFHDISNINWTTNNWQRLPISILAESSWKNNAISKNDKSFKISFELTPSADYVDAVTGISSGTADSYQDLACIVRLSPAGLIDVRDGSSYRSDTPFPYKAESKYRVELDINLTEKTYSASVDGTIIATGYSFRSEQSSVEYLDNIATFVSNEETQVVSEISLYKNELATPSAPLGLNIASKK